MLPEVMLRREFKIAGQIGESGQKEKLSNEVNEARKVENERQEKRCTVVKSPKVQELQSEIQTDSAPTQGNR